MIVSEPGGDELPYEEIPTRIAQLAEELEAGRDPDFATRLGELLDWIDAFHLTGLRELVAMIREWRGEIFLEHATSHPVVGLLLAGYGLGVPGSTPPPAPADVTAPSAVSVRIGRKPAP